MRAEPWAVAEHPVSGREPCHARADGLDDSRELVTEYGHARPDEAGQRADEERLRSSDAAVGSVHARRVHRDPHLAVTHLRGRHVGDVHDPRRAVRRPHGGPHASDRNRPRGRGDRTRAFVGVRRDGLGMMHGVRRISGKDTVMTVAEPEVRVAAGALRGRLESGVVVFKGIPFAEPPARFAAPEPVAAWDGTRDALSYGPPPPAVRPLRHGRARRVRRGLADGQRVDARPGREPAGDGVDPGRRLPVRHVRPARVRRRQAGAGRRRCRGHVQLPGGHRGIRPDRRSAREPRPARPGRRAGMGTGQHRRVRRRPRTRSRCSASPRAAGPWPRCWRCHGRPACSAARSCRACRARSSRPSWPPTSPASSRPSWA